MVESKQSMMVASGDGKPVRWRVSPSKDAAAIGKLFVGTAVEQQETDGAWSRIVYQGQSGYMMCEFLKAAQSAAGAVTRAEFDALVARVAEMEGSVG